MKKILITLNPLKNLKSIGGGNYFVQNLINYLKQNNFEVLFKFQNNIDLIILIDPKKKTKFGKNYSLKDVLEYKNKNPKTKILYRVNDCDKKRTASDNDFIYAEAIKSCDYVVFISKWLKNYYFEKYQININNYSIIYNGVNKNYFYKKKK